MVPCCLPPLLTEMTESEAREKLLAHMSKLVDDEYPLPWVGDVIEEGAAYFVFEAAIYKEGEDPRADSVYFFVNTDKEGNCGPVLE
jgi:hypothetical protein